MLAREILEVLAKAPRGRNRSELYDSLRTKKIEISRLKLAGGLDVMEDLGLIKRQVRRPYMNEEITDVGTEFLRAVKRSPSREIWLRGLTNLRETA